MVVLVNAPQQLLNVTEVGSDLAVVKSTSATVELSELIGSASDRFLCLISKEKFLLMETI